MQNILWGAAVAAGLVAAAAPALALDAVQVGSGFNTPVYLTAPTGDSRLFVVEKAGRIQMLSGGTVSTYLDIRTLVDSAGEGGLLGLAFDPNFNSNGRFFVNYIDNTTKNTVVASFNAGSAGATTANATSRQTILSIDQPGEATDPNRPTNHKAGWIGFRPGDTSGQLYIATGDGGSSNDPQNRAQNLNDPLGKILRVTPGAVSGYTVPTSNPFVGGTTALDDAVWAYGLRNPYRNSFDRQSGNLWIADVGQGAREEVNLELADAAGGANYGWRAREGTADNPGVGDAAPANATGPLYDYAHGASTGASIIGGYVYRGTGEPGLDGTYFFGDFVSGRIFTLDGGLASGFQDRTVDLGTPFGANQLTSFGEDGLGNLYAMGLNGNIFRIAAAVPEPGTWAMLLSGLLVAGAFARRRVAAGAAVRVSRDA